MGGKQMRSLEEKDKPRTIPPGTIQGIIKPFDPQELEQGTDRNWPYRQVLSCLTDCFNAESAAV
jgi:hypothetical protein